ncbi:hypothetical protein Mmc1_3595 [Magnetococcus marinus MC-1]|uniref:Uncharacterized protein n=1 Tax=Magnetococcus marinus (strain ATCC BAA-1437 / JCM 17883 / MC-1) TaxID=156889 RepID=A0LDN7_MAGMM|nr:hypothetical protein [Magnetococcus marinus]ABK46080.1 hypothetical protein Mmc1_3595 [Magnetococcus marinus MC-1]
MACHSRSGISRWRSEEGGFIFYFAIILLFTSLTTSVIIRWVSRTQMEGRTNTVREHGQYLLLARDTVEGFAAINYRLPCPASDLLGVEDCKDDAANTVMTGYLPWRTLGLLSSSGFYGKNVPKYAVHSNGATVDSATSPDQTDLTSGDGATTKPPNLKNLCDSLTLLIGDNSNAYIYTDNGVGTTVGIPFIIVHSGIYDRDGDGDLYDGLNGDNPSVLDFETSEQAREGEQGQYDDWVVHSGTGRSNSPFLDMYNMLKKVDSVNCP